MPNPARALLAALALSGALIAADTPSLEDRLRALELRVDALQRENADLRRQLTPPPAPTASRPAQPTTADTPVGIPQPGGKEAKLVVGGFLQAQAEFGDAGDARFAGVADRLYFRRARIYLAGSFAENFDFKIEGDFSANSLSPGTGLRAQANEYFIGWSRYPTATIRVGQIKSAFGSEYLASDTRTPTIERFLASDRLTDSRQPGVMLGGEFFNHRLGYLVGVANGSGMNASANDNSKFHQSARLFGTPFESAQARLTLGANVMHSEDLALSKPGLGLDSVAGGALDNLFTGRRDGWGADIAWHLGLLDLSAEVLRVRYHPANRFPASSFTAQGFHVTATYFLLPKQLQAVLRHEQFDPNLSCGGDSTENWVAGFNYFIKGDDLKLMVDYVFGRAASLPHDHGRLLTRFQVLY